MHSTLCLTLLTGSILGTPHGILNRDRFGLDVIRQATRDIFEATEAKFRAFIASIPDGVYTAEVCNDNDSVTDEPVWARVKVTVKGEEITVDTTGSDKQHAGNINVGLPSTKAMAKLALAFLYPSPVPEVNHGSFTSVHVIAERGSIFWSQEPVAGMRPVPALRSLPLTTQRPASAARCTSSSRYSGTTTSKNHCG